MTYTFADNLQSHLKKKKYEYEYMVKRKSSQYIYNERKKL